MPLTEIRRRLQDMEILVVPYCHCDWAWTHTRAWHEARYVQVFEQVLELMRGDPGFRWYLDSWVTQLQPLLDHRPDLVPELQQRVREGKVAICGGFANVRPNMVGEETFLRSLIHGRRRFRALFPEADLSVHADIVDVALGHPQVPQLIRLAGYEAYRAWRPQAGLTEAGVPYEWVWEGLDGTQLLCSRGCYGGLCAPDIITPDYADNWDQAVLRLWQRELELVSRHCPSGLAWWSQGMDDGLPLRSHGGDVLLDLPGLMAEWNRREQAPMRFATPVEFYAELAQRRERLPVHSGTLDPCDVCYNAAWGGAAGLWRKRFVADAELVSAEAWDAILAPRAAAAGGTLDATVALDFARLWENTLLVSAHATQWLFQRDFDELDELVDRTILEARQGRRGLLSALARRVPQGADGSCCAAVVFNSLPFARTELVEVLATRSEGLPGPVQFTAPDGAVLPSQQVTAYEYAGRIWEADALVEVTVPAFGYTTVDWSPAGDEAASLACRSSAPLDADPTMANGLLTLHFENHAVAAVSLPGGGEYRGSVPFGCVRAHDVDTNAPLHVGPITAIHDAAWERGEVVEAGPLRWRHVARGLVAHHPVTLETRLYRGQSRVEFALTCDWRGAAGFLAAVWPTPFEGVLETDVNFGAEEKHLEDIRYGPIEGHLSGNIERLREGAFYARSFVSLSDGARAITHVSHDGDRYYVRDAAAGTLAQILINSLLPESSGWEQHVNVQRDGVTRHQFTWSVVFHAGDWRAAGLARTAAALRQPPEVLAPHGSPGVDLPAGQSFLQVEPANVMLSAFYREAAGHGSPPYSAAGHGSPPYSAAGHGSPPYSAAGHGSPSCIAAGHGSPPYSAAGHGSPPYSEAVLLRVWETHGVATEMEAQLPFAPLTASLVDLGGEALPEESQPVLEGRGLRLHLRPWQVATVRLVP